MHRRSRNRSADAISTAAFAMLLGPGCIVNGLLDGGGEETTTSTSTTTTTSAGGIDPAPEPGSSSGGGESDSGPPPSGTAETTGPEDDQRDPAVPPPANDGDCCEPSRGTGCGDPTIEACVCAVDPRCCTDGWDALCVDHVEELACGACTFEPAGLLEDCCSPHDAPACVDEGITSCVCAADPYCCEVAWDQVCIDLIGSLGCGVCPGPYAPDDCCTPGEVAGCPDPTITECVCAQDPYCCEDHWDELCVDQATTYCGGCFVDVGTTGIDMPPPDETSSSSGGDAMTY